MTPELAKQLISVLSSIALVLQSFVAHPGIYTLQQKQQVVRSTHRLFGAITTTAGFTFATSSYLFNDNDTINAGDFNLTLQWIGTRNSTDTTSLSYKLTNASSVDPGLKITSASASGTWPVANGGTGTSTVPSDSQLFSASGTTPTWKNITVGTGLTLSTSTTGISFNTLSQSNSFSIYTGEQVSTGSAVFAQQMGSLLQTNQTSTDGAQFGCASPSTSCGKKLAESFTLGSTSTVSALAEILSKRSSPVDNVIMSIQSNTSGATPCTVASANCPSGTYLASTTIANASITAAPIRISSSTYASTTLSPNTIYWFVLERTGSLDDTNDWLTTGYADDRYVFGVELGFDGSAYGTYPGKNTLDIAFDTGIDQTGIGMANDTTPISARRPVLGISNGFYATSTLSTVVISGVLSGFTSLIPGKVYYSSSTNGGIGFSSSSVSTVVGVAASSTALSINIIPK